MRREGTETWTSVIENRVAVTKVVEKNNEEELHVQQMCG